jgi:ferredoxin
MPKYRIEIDREICQGFGACVELCPKEFYLSEEDGKSKLKNGEPASTGEGNAKDFIEVEDLGCYGQAEATCPFKAISVTRL